MLPLSLLPFTASREPLFTMNTRFVFVLWNVEQRRGVQQAQRGDKVDSMFGTVLLRLGGREGKGEQYFMCIFYIILYSLV